MKRLLLILFFLPGFLKGMAQKQMVVDANAEMRTLNGSFDKVKISNAIDLYLSQSDNESIAVSASEDKYKDAIKTVVEGNVLKIYYDGPNNWSSKNRKMKVYVSFRKLQSLEASGASDIVVAGSITVPKLHLNFSGASDFKGAVKTDKLELDLSGASDVTISGTAKEVNIESSGASDVKGFELVAESCTAKASGASDINITVNRELSAQASGASNISYQGSAHLKDSQTSGASNIRKRG